MRVYLDYNATVPLCAAAREAMCAAFELCGNASSIHREGKHIRSLIERARSDVSALVGAQPQEVIFVSGGTEANNMALLPSVCGGPRFNSGQRDEKLHGRAVCSRLLMSAVEHVSVREGHGFLPDRSAFISVDRQGLVDLDHAQHLLDESFQKGERVLVSLMLANNETGVIQPVTEMASLVHRYGGLIHCDAVQAAGKIPVDMGALDVDLMSLSAHKMGGPQGIGALFIRDGVEVCSFLRGGQQEQSHRAGTENLIGIAGFGASARFVAGCTGEGRQIAVLRERLEEGLQLIAPDVEFFSSKVPRLPNTSNFALAGLVAETAVIFFDIEGFAVSSGSACSSGKVSSSYVLQHMQVPLKVREGAVRVSIGPETTRSCIDRFLLVFERLVSRMESGGRT
ncbi:MAG: cysteine desulfurase family protein [Alphaproteobacteria bacterium]|nr:cysteine desulfurase family protein [Alphaproteobacteria bacterium]